MSQGTSLLSQLRKLVSIDIDSMDPSVTRRHEQYTFTDMTSNQAIVYNQATHPENKSVIFEAIEYVRTLHPNRAENAAEVADRLRLALDVVTVHMARLVYPYLTGKVHVQTSPSVAYDAEKTITHARRIVDLFEAYGIPGARVCIKIPATPAGIVACRVLSSPASESGFAPINTLATSVFSVAQAQAASQAGCVYVAPYYNELRAHFDQTTWVEYKDPGREHPMSSVIASIIASLKEAGSSILVMPASSIKTVQEVLALVSLRPDHITIPAHILDDLAAAPAVAEADLAPVIAPPPELETVDFLEKDAAALDFAIASNADVERRIRDAIDLFTECELRAMEYVRSGTQTLGVKWDGTALWY
ncbi:hypothetical protein H0H92_009292 [Tricholoma furcatifolium]|nr:hypothetical protein H0H92_009292 [Tricholoma furcatifolium]